MQNYVIYKSELDIQARFYENSVIFKNPLGY